MTCHAEVLYNVPFKYCPIQVSSCSHLALCSGCQTVILCKSFPSKDNSLINPSLETNPWVQRGAMTPYRSAARMSKEASGGWMAIRNVGV